LALAAFFLLSPQLAHAQQLDSALVPENPLANTAAESIMVVPRQPTEKPPVDREISVMDMVPFGDYRMFSATVRCNAWTVGVEYDRDAWGHFLYSRIDYVAEIQPVLILNEPAKSDFWGNAISPNQQLLPGLGISPFGFRMLWRGNKAIKPYIIGKIGIDAFTQKALSPNASYANFNVQADFGLEIRVNDRVELRVDPFAFYHVSNGYLAQSNPGMDELAGKIGISYHVGKHLNSR
jgi:hypothetical protein